MTLFDPSSRVQYQPAIHCSKYVFLDPMDSNAPSPEITEKVRKMSNYDLFGQHNWLDIARADTKLNLKKLNLVHLNNGIGKEKIAEIKKDISYLEKEKILYDNTIKIFLKEICNRLKNEEITFDELREESINIVSYFIIEEFVNDHPNIIYNLVRFGFIKPFPN
jgi:hypothetical protein